jgi:hypothetical protein
LFAAQWATGLVPYIVYDPTVPPDAYFPDAARWATAVSAQAPRGIATGGLCQPPVHAIALNRICALAYSAPPALRKDVLNRARRLFPAVLKWHTYLATYRDPQRSGLVTVYHPWESGTDNSPRWDAPLDRLTVGDLPPYVRRDTQTVDGAQRPSDTDYDRYLWLLELLKRRRFDEASIAAHHPFAVKDVFFSAVFAAANDALREVGELVGAPCDDRGLISGWRARTLRALAGTWDDVTGLCLDYDLRARQPLRRRTFAGLSPLLAAGIDPTVRTRLLDALDSAEFLGRRDLGLPVLPTTSPADPAFDPQRYWRGSVWPVINWLFGHALQRAGEVTRSAQLRRATLELVDAGGLCEYFDARTGLGLGSMDQTWTAAVVLDWVAGDARCVDGGSR